MPPKLKNLLDKNKLILYLLIIVIVFMAFALINKEPQVSIKPLAANQLSETQKLVRENHELRQRLSKIEPASPVKIVAQNKPSQAIETVPVATVMTAGTHIPFEINYEDEFWVRPDYEPYWHSNLGQWSSLPDRIHSAYHHLFVTLGTKGLWNETVHESGIAEISDKINLSIYNDKPEDTVAVVSLQQKITDVFVLNNQVILVGTPCRAGLQVLSINKQDLINSVSGELLAQNNNQEYLFQLVTPDGYETDYNNTMISF